MADEFHTKGGMRVRTTTSEYTRQGHYVIVFDKPDSEYTESYTLTDDELDTYIINLIRMKIEVHEKEKSSDGV